MKTVKILVIIKITNIVDDNAEEFFCNAFIQGDSIFPSIPKDIDIDLFMQLIVI